MAPSVAAHRPGSSLVSANGKFVLTPQGSANASMGPPIAFDIHSHVGGYLEYLNVTGGRANNSWSVPGWSDYAVQWTNPNPQSENVTYAFQLVPPPLDLWPLYLLLVAPLAMIGALIWYSRRKKRRSHSPVGRGRRAGFQKIDIQDRRYIICAPSHGSR